METRVPFISVLMITYNSSEFLNEAIDSVLKLEYENFELVISDDNSTDNSWEIINSYEDQRIVKNRNEKNLGEYNNRNKAIQIAKGDYVIYIDGDDMIFPHALKYLSALAVKFPDCAMLLGHGWDPVTFDPVIVSPDNFYRSEYLDKGVYAKSFVNLFFKRQAFIEVGGFDDAKIKMGDKYIQYKIGLRYNSLLIAAGFAHWRLRAGQASEFVNDTFKYTADNYRIIFPFLKADVAVTAAEKALAKEKIYRGYVRMLVRQLLALNFKKVMKLYATYPFPVSFFFRYLPKSPVNNYFDTYAGGRAIKAAQLIEAKH